MGNIEMVCATSYSEEHVSPVEPNMHQTTGNGI